MHLDEVALVLTSKRYARCTVCFIAYDDIEVDTAFLLKCRYDLNGLIGRKKEIERIIGILTDIPSDQLIYMLSQE